MAANVKPITVWSLGYSPNPWKIFIILEELGIPYEEKTVTMASVKEDTYLALNPNGRVPTIEDPNTGITLWESGAIVEYLIQTYDKESKLSYPLTSLNSHHVRNWAFFQTTGQGPYYGQLAWFTHHHSEKLPSVLERYRKEVLRVQGVIDLQLSRGGPYLTGEKCTYADLMFVPYIRVMEIMVAPDLKDTEGHEKFKAWKATLFERPSVKKVVKQWDDVLAQYAQQSAEEH